MLAIKLAAITAAGLILSYSEWLLDQPVEIILFAGVLASTLVWLMGGSKRRRFFLSLLFCASILIVWLQTNAADPDWQTPLFAAVVCSAMPVLDEVYDPGWKHSALRSALVLCALVFCLILPSGKRLIGIGLLIAILAVMKVSRICQDRPVSPSGALRHHLNDSERELTLRKIRELVHPDRLDEMNRQEKLRIEAGKDTDLSKGEQEVRSDRYNKTRERSEKQSDEADHGKRKEELNETYNSGR